MGGLKIWYNDECSTNSIDKQPLFNEWMRARNEQQQQQQIMNYSTHIVASQHMRWHSLSENITVNLNSQGNLAQFSTVSLNRTTELSKMKCANVFFMAFAIIRNGLCNNCQKSGWNYDYLLSISCNVTMRTARQPHNAHFPRIYKPVFIIYLLYFSFKSN